MLFQMLWAIELNDEFVCEANKINDVATDCSLATKLPTTQLLSVEEVPQAPFGIRRFVAKRAGKLALVVIALHASLCTPP